MAISQAGGFIRRGPAKTQARLDKQQAEKLVAEKGGYAVGRVELAGKNDMSLCCVTHDKAEV